MSRTFFWGLVLFPLGLIGCGGQKGDPASPAPRNPEVRLVHPQKKDIVRTVGQPGFVEAYEQTSIYPKVNGYIEKWNVDIGDRVTKNQLLTTIFVPELVEEHRLKIASVALDEILVEQANRMVEVADGNWKASIAKVTQTKADVIRYQAEVDRWKSEVTRLASLVEQRVVDKQVLDESTRQLRSNESSRDAALAAVTVSESDRIAKAAELAKARVDVAASKARVVVSQAAEKRLSALVGYLKLTSPFEGIVVVRNANTGDFVQGTTGDQTATGMSPDLSTSKGAPIYVIARTDIVRVFVDIPEMDANFVTQGNDAEVWIQAFQDMKIPAKVTRTSWALNVKTRTLRAEIDLPNEGAKLLPGMYAYGYVKVKRPGVMVLPTTCIGKRGDLMVGFLLKDGKAVQTTLRLGVSDGGLQEVIGREENGISRPIQSSDTFLMGDMTELTDGIAVKVLEDEKGSKKE